MTTTSNSANDCILSKPFVYFRRLSRGHSVKVSGSTSDISPLPNSNVPRPFLRPNKIKWRIKGRLRQTTITPLSLISGVNPLASSDNSANPAGNYQSIKKEETRAYEQRVIQVYRIQFLHSFSILCYWLDGTSHNDSSPKIGH